MKTIKHKHKIYNADECCLFRKTKELYGGLSNMASGFPLNVNGIKILSSEALYQACRFPHLPFIQEKIIKERSPYAAKLIGKQYKTKSRSDWYEVRVRIMRWCLSIKLAQNFQKFGKVLESTLDRPIVEFSSKDDFWGAIQDKQNKNILKGTNALGRLLMELREFYYKNRYSYDIFVIEPLNLLYFTLFGRSIEKIDERENFLFFIMESLRYNESEKNKTLYNRVTKLTKLGSRQSSLNTSRITLDKTLKHDGIKQESIKKKSENNLEEQISLQFEPME